MKNFIYALILLPSAILASNIAALPPSTYSNQIAMDTKPEEKIRYPYIGLGFSSFVVVPYAANISLGSKWAKPNEIVGLDASLNLTSTFVSQYGFGKILVPFYITPETVTSSYFAGPFLTGGLNYQFEKFSGLGLAKGFSLLSIVGISVGKNIDRDGKLSFWQLSANIRRFNTGPYMKSSPWPTITFQYGIGF